MHESSCVYPPITLYVLYMYWKFDLLSQYWWVRDICSYFHRLENHAENLSVRGVEVRLALWDTAGHEEYDRLRPLAYPKTDVVVLCFSVANYDSFKNIPDLWYPEIAHYCQNVPIILVGNKIDLRDDPSALSQPEQLPQVTKEQAMQMAERIKAVRYIECSAKTQEGLKEVFVTATEVGVFPELYVPNRSRRRRRICSLL